MAEVEALVRSRICGVCSDRTEDGACGREEPSGCALFHLFREVAEAIQRTDSDDIRDYIESIRVSVCALCEGRAADGSCEQRREVRCALDAYLLLVVDAIEEATGKVFSRGSFSSIAGSPKLAPRMVL